ncbi:hypothetical protein SK128_020790, partial [Halocaridina rubra]
GLLSRAGKLEFDKFGNLKPNSEGYLVIRSWSKWEPVCAGVLPDDIATHVCDYLGY